MLKTNTKNLISIKIHTLSLALLLTSTSILPSVVHAATNPAGSTINSMEATTSDTTLENYGTILNGALYSVAGDYRIAMYGNSSGTASYNFSNFGDITINDAQAHSYGMFAKSDTGSHTLTNNGTINIISIDKLVHGMYAQGDGSHTLINNGTILLRSPNSNNAELLIAMYMYTDVVGGSHTLINNGTIIINAYKASYGMYSSNSANLHNSGYIKIRGTGQEIFGMRGEEEGLTISNTGIIDVWADNGIASEALAYEGNLNVGTWATSLRNYSINDNVFGIYSKGQVNFNNNKLILRPGTSAQGFQLGKTYNVSDMIVVTSDWKNILRTGSVDVYDSDSNLVYSKLLSTDVTGNIAEAVTEVPFLKATLVNGNDPLNATVRLDSNISESTTPGAATMQQAVAQVQGQFNNLSASLREALINTYTKANLVADAGQNKTRNLASGDGFYQDKPQVFITPYANAVNNSKYNYDGYNMGITAGATYKVRDNLSFGGHLDISSGDYDADLMNMSTDTTSVAFGVHAVYNFKPEQYLRGQLTAAINQNDSDYNTSGLSADSDYNGAAIYAELATGHIWQIDNAKSIIPEIGLSYLGMRTDAYDINFSNPLYNMSYDDSSYNAFYITANVDGRSEWEYKNDSKIAMLAGLGIRQALSSSDMKANFSTVGSNFSTKSTEDSTTFLADVGVEYSKDNFSISLNYDGSYGAHQTSHGGNVMLKIDF